MSKVNREDVIVLPSLTGAGEVPLDLIAVTVAKYYQITQKELFTRLRKLDCLKRKYMFYLLARKFNRKRELSLEKIGMYCMTELGMKEYDHTTVMNGLKEGGNILETDVSYRIDFEELVKLIEDQYTQHTKGEVSFRRKKREVILDVLACQDREQLEEMIERLKSA